MKKIMFNDKFLLTKAVLNGTKTMTRRVIKKEIPIGNWQETEKELYKSRRAEIIGQILSMKFRHLLPRTVKARLRMIARLDAEQNETDWEDEYTELLNEFGLKR